MRRWSVACSRPTRSPGRPSRRSIPLPAVEGPVPTLPGQGMPDPEAMTLESLERRHTERLLAHHRNVTRVADILGINRRTLQRKLRAWGIDAD